MFNINMLCRKKEKKMRGKKEETGGGHLEEISQEKSWKLEIMSRGRRKN